MSEWQPIETAPKDGTVILGAEVDPDTGYFVCQMAWHGTGWGTEGLDDNWYMDAVAWMKRPMPPNADSDPK